MNGANYGPAQGYGEKAGTYSERALAAGANLANQCDGAAAKPVSQAESLLNELRYTQDDTAALLEGLSRSSVFSPAHPLEVTKTGTGSPATSPLCEELFARLAAQHRLNDWLRDLAARITA